MILVDLGHTVLAPFSDEAHAYAAKQLQRRGVELRLGVSMKEIAADHVALSDGTTLKTHLTVWGGGLMAAPLSAQSGVSPGRGGRLDVQPDLTVEGLPGVYALGDFANIPSGNDDALPQLGSVAQQAGDWAAKNILAGMEGKLVQPFHYKDKGIMAMIGRKAAVAEVGEHRHELHGRIAFAAWLGVHAQLLANAGAEVKAFMAWADEFYVRPHHRSAALLDPSTVDTPRIDWSAEEARRLLVGDDHVAAGVPLDRGGDVRAEDPCEQAVVVRADHDQLGPAILGRFHDLVRGVARGPHVLTREARGLDALFGLREHRFELGRLDEGDHPCRRVVQRAEVLRTLGFSGISATATTTRWARSSRASSIARSSALLERSAPS